MIFIIEKIGDVDISNLRQMKAENIWGTICDVEYVVFETLIDFNQFIDNYEKIEICRKGEVYKEYPSIGVYK